MMLLYLTKLLLFNLTCNYLFFFIFKLLYIGYTTTFLHLFLTLHIFLYMCLGPLERFEIIGR